MRAAEREKPARGRPGGCAAARLHGPPPAVAVGRLTGRARAPVARREVVFVRAVRLHAPVPLHLVLQQGAHVELRLRGALAGHASAHDRINDLLLHLRLKRVVGGGVGAVAVLGIGLGERPLLEAPAARAHEHHLRHGPRDGHRVGRAGAAVQRAVPRMPREGFPRSVPARLCDEGVREPRGAQPLHHVARHALGASAQDEGAVFGSSGHRKSVHYPHGGRRCGGRGAWERERVGGLGGD